MSVRSALFATANDYLFKVRPLIVAEVEFTAPQELLGRSAIIVAEWKSVSEGFVSFSLKNSWFIQDSVTNVSPSVICTAPLHEALVDTYFVLDDGKTPYVNLRRKERKDGEFYTYTVRGCMQLVNVPSTQTLERLRLLKETRDKLDHQFHKLCKSDFAQNHKTFLYQEWSNLLHQTDMIFNSISSS